MKTLHDIFDKLGLEKVKAFANLLFDGKDNDEILQEAILATLAAYAAEKGIEPEAIKLKTEELQDMVSDVAISAGLYVNADSGYLIINGRLKLTDGNTTTEMTEKGKNHVEKTLLT